jgi:hypothetical protein
MTSGLTDLSPVIQVNFKREELATNTQQRNLLYYITTKCYDVIFFAKTAFFT